MNVEKRPLAQPNQPRTNLQHAAAGMRARLLREGLTLLLLLALTLLGLLNADRLRVGPAVDFNDPPADSGMDVIGINLTERNAAYAYRWTTDYTFAQIPHGYNAAPSYIAAVRLSAGNPAGPQPLTFLANERPLATVTPSTGFRTYRFVLPPALAADDAAVRFALQTTPFTSTADTRKLGVLLTSIAFAPIHSAAWGGALLLVAALAALWTWLRWRGETLRGTLMICGIVAGALLTLSALYSPAPLRFPLLALLALGGTAAGALLARETASRMALAALALLVSFSGVLWPSWMTDDAIISFRYAENLVAGNGLVYNVGERVEGYTNFLWTMLAALVLWLGGDPIWWSYVAGVVLALLILLLAYWLARRLIGPGWALVAALFVATSQSLLIYTARGAGLETGLFTLLVLAGSAIVLRTMDDGRWTMDNREQRNKGTTFSPISIILSSRHLVIASFFFALATLTRPEGALVLALTAMWIALGQTRANGRTHPIAPTFSLVVGYLLIFLPYFVWRYNYYGEWLPNTFYAKTGGGLRQVLRGLEYAGGFALAMCGPLLLVALVPTLAEWQNRRTTNDEQPSSSSIKYQISIVHRLSSIVRSWRGYLLLLTGVYSAYIIVVGGDHFPGERFFVPLVPWLALLLADGLAWLYGWLRHRSRGRRVAPAALALLLVAYSGYALGRTSIALGRPYPIDIVMRGDDESVWVWRELGWWFHDHAAPGESIAASGAGAIAYYSDHETIDLLGLNDKHIARVSVADAGAGTAGHEKRDPAYVLNVRRPTYIPRIWDEYFGGEAVLRGPYQLVTIHTRYDREMELWKRVP